MYTSFTSTIIISQYKKEVCLWLAQSTVLFQLFCRTAVAVKHHTFCKFWSPTITGKATLYRCIPTHHEHQAFPSSTKDNGAKITVQSRRQITVFTQRTTAGTQLCPEHGQPDPPPVSRRGPREPQGRRPAGPRADSRGRGAAGSGRRRRGRRGPLPGRSRARWRVGDGTTPAPSPRTPALTCR